MLKIHVPTIDKHSGCCFREILKIWEQKGLVELVTITKEEFDNNLIGQYIESHVWLEEIGKYLLYDKPLWDTRIRFGWQKCLMANEFVPFNGTYRWTFWPTHPIRYEKLRLEGIKSYSQRPYESIFFGTGGSKRGNRKHNWGEVVENFSLTDEVSPLNYEDYIRFMSQHKFGLSLTGVGPKCLRDVEYMGMGVVPLFTREVSVEYFNRLEQNKHYLLVDNVEHAKDVIKNTTQEEWEYLSANVIEWYEQNCTPESIFNLTMKIIYEME